MKIDRLISILSLLLQKDKVTTAELADKFEVSRRTILRDIDALNRAGIPVVSSKGYDGGISVIENYKLDRTLLSIEEMKAILAGLQSLDSVSNTKKYQRLMEKLYAEDSSKIMVENNLIIDLSMWDKSEVSYKIDIIKTAIDCRNFIEFTYYSPNGISERIIEPYKLVFQWSNWYVWGYCTEREDYRMFKLSRIEKLKTSEEKYTVRQIPEYTCDKLRHTRGSVEATVVFDKSVKWRLIDEWGHGGFQEDDNGNIVINFTWADKESLFNWILTFADAAEVISPLNFREEFVEKVKKIYKKYDK